MSGTKTSAVVVALAIILVGVTSILALSPVNKSFLGGVAIKGYDSVAYFTDGKAIKGLKENTYEWNGAKWHFATRENLEKFRDSPEKYAPQYGGYCAWSVSIGETANVDPEVWQIVEGRLYLNHDQSVQEKWEKDIPGNIEKADGNWPKLLRE